MDRWISHSRPARQLTVAALCALAGLVLLIGFRDFSVLGTNALAGFLLGLLLFLIGVAGLLTCGRQTIVVDPKARLIFIEDSNRFGTKSRKIMFQEIESVGMGYLGKKSNFVEYHYLQLSLRNGEKYPLFAPGRYYQGASDRGTVASWKQRLESYLVSETE